jgi:hypothetical protein
LKDSAKPTTGAFRFSSKSSTELKTVIEESELLEMTRMIAI